jgi:hypothetical protein
MGVVQSPFQTVEEIYGLVWAAVANRQPIEGVYQGRQRLFCPHRLGRNRMGDFAFCAISTVATAGAGSNPLVLRRTGVVLFWKSSAE